MLLDHLQSKLDAIAARHQTRALRIAESPTAPRQTVRDAAGTVREQLLFCSNDYLGLAAHPAIAAALVEGVQRWGGGSGASHLISGHSAAHEQLDTALADCFAAHIPEVRALSFCTGYMANLAVMTALGDADTEMFSDALNHASLIDGMRLARGNVQRYAHGDLDDLRTRLAASTARIKLIVTDTVFSMDGDIAPLPALLALAETFDAWLVLDDAHGFGVLGTHGHGALEHFALRSERLILVGTLGKAAGLSGAFVAAHARVIAYLLQAARTYIFTTAALPAVAHALLTSLALIAGEEGQARRAHLDALRQRLRAGIATLLERHPQLPWRLADSNTPIQPLIVGDNATVMALAAHMEAVGLRVPGIRPPTVPAGQARLRITLCASHTTADVDRLLDALASTMHTLESR